MKYFYCEKLKGFLAEDDKRATKSMIKVTEAQHKKLMNEQSEGREIVIKKDKIVTIARKVK